jgi:hypothetical protein
MVAKSSHILVHIVLGRLGLMGKYLFYGVMGKNFGVTLQVFQGFQTLDTFLV